MTKEVKTDVESVLALCNALNVWQGMMRREGHSRVADRMQEAEHLITRLYLENHRLREKLKKKGEGNE